MKIRIIIFIIASIFLSKANADERINQWSCYKILKEVKSDRLLSKKMQELALSGDKDSAYALAQNVMKINERQHLCWLLVAAENGHANAQYNLWIILRNSIDHLDRKRAEFWLMRSAGQKFPPAVKDKKKLEG